MGFFDSPRSVEGKKQWAGVQGDINAMSNPFANINTTQDVSSTYGVKAFDTAGYGDQVRRTFDPQRKMLANKQGQSQRALGDRMGRSATPGIKSSALDASFADAFSNLGMGEAQGVLGGYDKEREQQMNIANLLKGAQEGNVNAQGQKMNLKMQGIKNYLDSLSGTSGFDDVLAGASAVGKLAGGIGGFTGALKGVNLSGLDDEYK